MKCTIIGIAAALFGIVLGDWLALSRDRRREFNAVTEQLFKTLASAIDSGHFGGYPTVEHPRLIEPYILRWKRRAFRRAVKEYETAKQGTGTYEPVSGIFTVDQVGVEHLVSCAKRLLHYLSRR